MTVKIDWSYDAIADVYSTDMGQSMPFDDIGWYRTLCLAEGGRTLELGCGTGRILIELARAGIDAVGADRSLPMLSRLRRDAQTYTLSLALLQMDIAQPALAAQFHTILMPYSLITYLRNYATAVTTLRHYAAMLSDGGCLVVDAFVPRPVESFADFRQDYWRAHGDGFLARHKRIAVQADGCNRIERRYRLHAADRSLRDEFFTDETIRPYTPDALAALAEAAGLRVDRWAWDYGAGAAEQARFATVVLRR
jgi:ubiquinone/menaquinone biosynthesis C-methylase UbiE